MECVTLRCSYPSIKRTNQLSAQLSSAQLKSSRVISGPRERGIRPSASDSARAVGWGEKALAASSGPGLDKGEGICPRKEVRLLIYPQHVSIIQTNYMSRHTAEKVDMIANSAE
jgi:hypothetical protein